MSIIEKTEDERVENVRLILRDFLKVIKVVSLYPEDNPLPQSLRRTFAERLVDLVDSYGPLEFSVDRENLCWCDKIVFTDRSKEESLAGLFFDCGIIRIGFTAGIEVENIYCLLDTIKAFQNDYDSSADLAATLWEAGLERFTFETVEDISLRSFEGDFHIQELGGDDEADNPASAESNEGYDSIFQSDDSATDGEEYDPLALASETDERGPELICGSVLDDDAAGESNQAVNEAARAMGLDDLTGKVAPLPDTTLILNDELRLSEEETKQVERLLVEDAQFCPYEATCELLKEILHQEPEMTDFYDSVTVCDRAINEFVRAGKLTFAADLLRYIGELEKQLRDPKPLWAERLKDARITAGGRERLETLKESLNRDADIGHLELRRYLDNFDWEALINITDLLGDLTYDAHRDALKDYLTHRGQDRVHIIARSLEDKRSKVVTASISILSRIGDETSLKHLSKMADHPEREVRLALVTALVECPSNSCLRTLQRMVQDEDAGIRCQAVRSIVARSGQAAFDIMVDIVAQDQFQHLELVDQQAVLTAYSTLGGDLAVPYLVSLIEKVNLLRQSGPAFYRAAAFESLAYNRSESAEAALLKLTGSWRQDIKLTAIATLKKRREIIFGGDDDSDE